MKLIGTKLPGIGTLLGQICRVLGHSWGYYDHYANGSLWIDLATRRCDRCTKEEWYVNLSHGRDWQPASGPINRARRMDFIEEVRFKEFLATRPNHKKAATK